MTEKLEFEIEYDCELLGIASNARPYKVAFDINHTLDIYLIKTKDIELHFLEEQYLKVLNFHFATEHNTYRLIKNKSVSNSKNIKPFIIPELEAFDFFLLIENSTKLDLIDEISAALSEIKSIQYVKKFDVKLLKSRDNLLF